MTEILRSTSRLHPREESSRAAGNRQRLVIASGNRHLLMRTRGLTLGGTSSSVWQLDRAANENEPPLLDLRQTEAALLKRLGFVTVRGRMLTLADARSAC